MKKHRLRSVIISCLILGATLLAGGLSQAAFASDDAFGEGTFGGCTFSMCPITLSSSSTVNANITPTAATRCTVGADTVGVTTDSTTGYTLTLTDGDTSNVMTGGATAATIAATSGTRASPAALTADKWGYRIDDSGGLGTGFGTGTTTQSNVALGSLSNNKFAAVPTSGSDELATSSVAADPTVNTTVWYGVCADLSVPVDTYTDTVTYTAVMN